MVCKSDSWSSKRFEYYISLWLAIRLKTSSSLFEGQNGWFFFGGKDLFWGYMTFYCTSRGNWVSLSPLKNFVLLTLHSKNPLLLFFCPSFTPCKIAKTMKGFGVSISGNLPQKIGRLFLSSTIALFSHQFLPFVLAQTYLDWKGLVSIGKLQIFCQSKHCHLDFEKLIDFVVKQ